MGGGEVPEKMLLFSAMGWGFLGPRSTYPPEIILQCSFCRLRKALKQMSYKVLWIVALVICFALYVLEWTNLTCYYFTKGMVQSIILSMYLINN